MSSSRSRGVFKTLWNNFDGALLLKAVNFFQKSSITDVWKSAKHVPAIIS